MTITVDRALPWAPRHPDAPVLAVLMTNDPVPEVLVWAAAAAQAFDNSLCVVYLEPRLGFTSPALVASTARRPRLPIASGGSAPEAGDRADHRDGRRPSAPGVGVRGRCRPRCRGR